MQRPETTKHWSKHTKQCFQTLGMREQRWGIPERTEINRGEPSDCPRLLPEGSIQEVASRGVSQAELLCLSGMRKWVWVSRCHSGQHFQGRAPEESEQHKERALDIHWGSSPNSSWICGRKPHSAMERKPERIRRNNPWNSSRPISSWFSSAKVGKSPNSWVVRHRTQKGAISAEENVSPKSCSDSK